MDNDADNDGICDEDEIETYNCINGQCIDPGNNMGQYLSLFDCQSSCNPSSIQSYKSVDKTLVKITNMLGQEIQFLYNTTMFFIYDDGSVEKIIIIN